MARSNILRVLTLSDTFFIDYGDRDHLDGLQEAIYIAEEHIKNHGMPAIDYKTYAEYSTMESKESLKNSNDNKINK